ncbi:uncharacterized protein LOC105284342 [Ooceraea biroi]|uniref:uncharacterized protein LOC105284342 n=1 Tax=Ooceraea biroi TaxID=2015173 RepID=UPI000F073765|nr:uncharacterized protein LOC105284342 [Ooceraea biroi]
MYSFALRTCLVCALLAAVFAEIPSYIKICSRTDPNINKCILNSIEQLRGKLATGIQELDVPAIEPLELKHIRLLRGPQTARLDVNLTNLLVSGPSKFEIRNFKADVSNLVFTYNLHFNQLDFRGKYKIDASILLLRLIGDGNVTGSFFDYESDSYMKANKIVKNNNTYIEFEKMKFRIKIGGAKINLDNLFGGDPILGPASNEVLNANSDLFLDEIKPVLEDALSNIFTNVANKITGSFTYDELFPSK